ncbi:MAG: hypothetical protein ABH817_02175 [archaeon]
MKAQHTALLFGLIILVVNLIPIAITQGFGISYLSGFPANPLLYQIISGALGLLLLILALTRKMGFY